MAQLGLRDYQKLLLAGAEWEWTVDGDYFLVVKAADELQLKFDDGDWITRVGSDGMPVRTYKKVRIKSDVDQTVVIALGYTGGAVTPVAGRVKFDGVVNASIDFPTQRQAEADVTIPAGTDVAVLPLDADRLSAIVQLDEAAPGPVRIGNSAVDNTHGAKLWPEDSADCAGSAPVYVFNPNGVDVIVHITTESAP